MKFGTGPRAKFHVYRGNVSPLRGEKPIFGLLSKNNTGMAALRAGLPVTNKQMDSIDALSRSCCRERWLNNAVRDVRLR